MINKRIQMRLKIIIILLLLLLLLFTQKITFEPYLRFSLIVFLLFIDLILISIFNTKMLYQVNFNYKKLCNF